MKEPETDEQYEAALEKAGYEMIDTGDRYIVRRLKTGAQTRMEAEDYSSALFEAWALVRP